MITEDYVSFEIAKLLKEKGFDSDECEVHYDPYNHQEYEITHQMAMKWLREVHNIQIVVSPYNTLNKTWGYYMFRNFEPLTQRFYEFKTYEEACEAAIKYCLENLV